MEIKAKPKPKKREITDVEIDRRIYREHTLVLLEDRIATMMLPDGTSKQYILAVESTSKEGNKYLTAKEGARAIFLHPGDFKSILGEDWVPFTHTGKEATL